LANVYYAGRELSTEEEKLGRVNEELCTRLTKLESELTTLRAQISRFDQKKSYFAEVISSVEQHQRECQTMQDNATRLSAMLYKDRQMLTNARMKIERISSDLRTVEYSQTRRNITDCLVGILEDLGQVTGSGGSNVKTFSKGRRAISKIETNTNKVLRILQSSQ
jgi:chromosome segregation ATPase